MYLPQTHGSYHKGVQITKMISNTPLQDLSVSETVGSAWAAKTNRLGLIPGQVIPKT